MKVLVIGVVVLACVMCTGVLAQGQTTEEELKRTNAELRERLDKLDKDLEEINRKIEERPAAVALQVEAQKPAVRSKYPVELYGYIKLDAAYDDSRVSTGNFARWVESEATNKDDDEFNMTANQTRLGLNFFGPETANLKTGGKVELDFYGGGPENKSHLMLRHAYLKVEWPQSDLSLLAGQTSDVISPLVPGTLNYTVAWWVGNPGYRRPQLRLTKGFKVGADSRLLLQAAAARTIGDSTAFSPGDTGEDAGFPTLQGRAALSFPLLTNKKTTLGISGHWGEEEYDTDAMDNHKHYKTWSANLDVTLPICPHLALKGELFTGENLDAYLAGIGQGVNTTSRKEIASEGGWAALRCGPFGKWRFTAGGGVDNPDRDDISTGGRERNVSIFANTIYKINAAAEAGLEVSHWDTKYKGMRDGESLRYQMSFIYKF